jgi:hypothetical protein
MARTVMRDPDRLANLFLAERDAVERRWLMDPPSGRDAFDEGSALLERWAAAVAAAAPGKDVRPLWVRSYWKKRDRLAGVAGERR